VGAKKKVVAKAKQSAAKKPAVKAAKKAAKPAAKPSKATASPGKPGKSAPTKPTKATTPTKSAKPAKPVAKAAPAAKPAKAAAPAKFSWKAFEKVVGKASDAVDADRHDEALALLEPVMPTLPAEEADPKEPWRVRATAHNLIGLAHKHAKAWAQARTAFETAARLGESYAELNLLDMMIDHERDFDAVLKLGAFMRAERYMNDYTRVWLARYLATAHLELGDVAAAETELRAIVDNYAINDAEKVREARAGIEKYIEAKRANFEAAQGFLAWLKEKSYEPTPEEAAATRAWWQALPEGVRPKLLEAVGIEAAPDDATDVDLARVLDAKRVSLDEDDGTFDDVTPLLRLANVKSLAFYGAPTSIEPLRALTKLAKLSINNDVIKHFAWPSPANRALWAAVEAGDRDAIDRALADGAEINARGEHGQPAVTMAAFKHDQELVLHLISKGADPWAGSFGEGDVFYFCGDEAKFSEAAVRAGIKHIDEEPYRILAVQREAKCTSVKPADTGLGLDFDDGVRLAATWPAGMKLQMQPPKKDNKLYPMTRALYDCAIVDESIAELLREHGETCELLPVTVVDHDGKARPEHYWFLNPIAIDCLDIAKCHPQWNHIDDDSASEVAAMVIDPAKTGGAQIFRPTILNSRPMIVTKELAAKLAGKPGVRIEHLKR